VPKIISKRCELVKLCHINRSGPFFLDSVYCCLLNCACLLYFWWCFVCVVDAIYIGEAICIYVDVILSAAGRW